MSSDLILIDAFSQIFRCFYAIRVLTNSRGEPTNALLPFVRILLKLQRDYPDNPGALVFDCGRVGFRMELNPEYKANRPPAPEELKFQIPIAREFAAAFGWPLLEEKEYEADDLIAAIARHTGKQVRIISSDKDLSQLVDERIAMMIPDTKNASWEIRDIVAVENKFKVFPEQMIDYLSLLGDASDNIPGVPGIGPKTASSLLRAHGSVEAMQANPEAIANERQRRLIVENRDVLDRNRKLIRLRTDLPERLSDIDSACHRTRPDWSRIAELCHKWELRSILKELPQDQIGALETSEHDDLPLFAEVKPEPAKKRKAQKDEGQDDLFGDF